MPITTPSRRVLLKGTAFLGLGVLASPRLTLSQPARRGGRETGEDRRGPVRTFRETTPTAPIGPDGLAVLPKLGFQPDALTPHIDAETMRLHHGEHHRSYVESYNEAIQQAPDLRGRQVHEVLANLDAAPRDVRRKLRNNGGGHYNHSMFWAILDPTDRPGDAPTGDLSRAIDEAFDGFESLKERFAEAAGDVFGSGWAWLIVRDGELDVTTTQDQDSPIMAGEYPVIGLDVWEHAYYLNYRNRRTEYIEAWWNVVNWRVAEERFRTGRG